MQVIEAPKDWSQSRRPRLFLAGSIEMGKAKDWQAEAIDFFANDQGTILNPRRRDWDSTWEQRERNPQFNEQVTWELDALGAADCVLLHFEPGTLSPISLLELGLFCHDQTMVVSCPDGYWRKGNVEIVCKRMNIHLENTLEGALYRLRDYVRRLEASNG